jgi:hypothetical protein
MLQLIQPGYNNPKSQYSHVSTFLFFPVIFIRTLIPIEPDNHLILESSGFLIIIILTIFIPVTQLSIIEQLKLPHYN